MADDEAGIGQTADESQGAKVKSGTEWKGVVTKDQDDLMEKSMNDTRRSMALAHPGAANANVDYEHINPLNPKNGFYDRRYVCESRAMADLDDEDDFSELFSDAAAHSKQISLALKNISDRQCEYIAQQLQADYDVQRLWLNDNPITAVGIAHIADALKGNKKLHELYLHYTDIKDEGLNLLLEMFGQNSSLRRVECGSCGITQVGANNVLASFKPGGQVAMQGAQVCWSC